MLFKRPFAVCVFSMVTFDLLTYGYGYLPISVIGRLREGRFCGLRLSQPQHNDVQPDYPTDTTYSNSDVGSKEMVSRLTNLVNLFGKAEMPLIEELPPPTSPTELMARIREDYVTRNYLWTGNLDLGCFELDCRFTDPTLSFVGRSKFVQNVQNLRPIVDRLITKADRCKSILFEIQLHPEGGYLESRWNMVGYLDALPWKPKVDVIGKTRFWYRDQVDKTIPDSVRIYWYDERWEVPTWMALLQLLTTSGTMPNTLQKQDT
jgi:hypothetical protein